MVTFYEYVSFITSHYYSILNYLLACIMYIGSCDYPTYYDTGSGECVFTCPSGTFGNVDRTANVTMRNCTSRKFAYCRYELSQLCTIFT